YTSTTTAPDKAEEAPKDFDFKPSINQDCPEEERADIEETLRDNVDCFARDGEQLGRCNVAEHEIHLTADARPIYQAPRPSSWKEQTIHRTLTQDMLKKGVLPHHAGYGTEKTQTERQLSQANVFVTSLLVACQ
ncbi:hypothetical protein DAPPUDRAFT_118348, partial [Daphnia pulex]